jgi:hypothetical protein
MLNYNPENTNWKNIENGLQKYLQIMKLVKNSNVQENEDFQRRFNGFYRVMKKPRNFYVALFECIESNKNKEISFEQVLEFFYLKFGKIEASFSSKVMATINPNFPVWDREVLARLNLKAPSYNMDKKVRFEKIVKTYDDIVNWYSEFLKTEQVRNMIKEFDERIGIYDIAATKKIDLILWQTRIKTNV